MAIIDYLLLAVASAAAIYTVYRLFPGWRKSAFPKQTLAAIRYWSLHDDLNLDDRAACGSNRLNGSNFEN